MKQSTKALLIAGGGLAVLGVGVYFLTRKPATTTSTSTTDALSPTTPTAGGSVVVSHDPTTGAPITRDQAGVMACKLRAIGHPNEAQFWADLVTKAGGTLPC